MSINADDVDVRDHEDGHQIKIRVPGRADITSVNQEPNFTVITVKPVDAEGLDQ